MSVGRTQEFERWYAEQDPEYIFDFQAEFLSYCESGVLLLNDACQCQEFEEISGFKPLERCITIASACNLFYRTKHMPKRQLLSEPVCDWHAQYGKRHSLAALAAYLYRKPNVHIQHARNEGENVIRRDCVVHGLSRFFRFFSLLSG